MKLINFENKNINLVEKRKIWFILPFIVVLIAIISGFIHGFISGSPLNLSMDFASGYSLTVNYGAGLTVDNQSEKEDEITAIIEGFTSGEGQHYGLKVDSFSRQSNKDESESSLNVKYKGIKGASVSAMETINKDLATELEEKLFAGDIYSGTVRPASSVSPTVSSELLINASCAILLALVLMLVYIAIRFELLSGISAIICLAHDLLIMLAFMVIFQIPISSTFIAALITILGYSINNTIIIFDKIRDQLKGNALKNRSYSFIANNSIMKTMVRSINTTGTTLITVVMVLIMSLIFSVESMVIFCIPLIVGLLAGTFSSILLAPSIWSMWKSRTPRVVAVDGKNSGIGRNAEPAFAAVAVAPIIEETAMPVMPVSDEEVEADSTEIISSDSTN